MDFTAIPIRAGGWSPRNTCWPGCCPATRWWRCCPTPDRIPLALRSCRRRLAELATSVNWLTGQRITSLAQVSQHHCDRYLNQRRRARTSPGRCSAAWRSLLRLAAAVVIELAHYGELFTTDHYARRIHPLAGTDLLPGRRGPVRRREQDAAAGPDGPAAAARRGVLPDRNGGTPPGGPAAGSPPRSPGRARSSAPPGPPLRTCTACSAWGTPTPASRCALSATRTSGARLTSGWAPDGHPLLPVSFTALVEQLHQLDRVRKAVGVLYPGRIGVAGRVAAQRQDVAHAHVGVAADHVPQLLDGVVDHGEVGHRVEGRLLGDGAGNRDGPLARRATGPVGHRDERRLERLKLADGVPELPLVVLGLGGTELERERPAGLEHVRDARGGHATTELQWRVRRLRLARSRRHVAKHNSISRFLCCHHKKLFRVSQVRTWLKARSALFRRAERALGPI